MNEDDDGGVRAAVRTRPSRWDGLLIEEEARGPYYGGGVGWGGGYRYRPRPKPRPLATEAEAWTVILAVLAASFVLTMVLSVIAIH